jgi:transcriptional regulator with XRE-family HTH domain
MRELKREEIEYAIGRLEVYITSRGLNQSDLEELSGVEQSTISKILHRKQEPSPGKPAETLRRSGIATRGRT